MIYRDTNCETQIKMHEHSKTVSHRRLLKKRRLSAHYLLSTMDDWNFNIFRMDSLACGRSLFNMGLKMFQDHGLIEAFNLDMVKLMRCLGLIEEGYISSNPYHNSIHAADVGQAMHCFLNEPKITSHLTPLEKMAAILAALAHDIAHPGVSNTFLINTTNHLASLYKNESVLENHHWRTVSSIFHQTGIFQHLDEASQIKLGVQIKSLILATDIARQHELLVRFKNISASTSALNHEENRLLTLQIALKCADVSNAVRQWDVTKTWSGLVCQEFFQQGDNERKLGLNVEALNDRHRSTVAQIQTGFIQYIVQPLFLEWKNFNPGELSNTITSNMEKNLSEWKQVAQNAQNNEENTDQDVTAMEIDDDVIKPTSTTSSIKSRLRRRRSSLTHERRQSLTGSASPTTTSDYQSPPITPPRRKSIVKSVGSSPPSSSSFHMCLRRGSLPVNYYCSGRQYTDERSSSLGSLPRRLGRRNSLPLTGIAELKISGCSSSESGGQDDDDVQEGGGNQVDTTQLQINQSAAEHLPSPRDYDKMIGGGDDLPTVQLLHCLEKSYNFAKRRCSAPNAQLTKILEDIAEGRVMTLNMSHSNIDQLNYESLLQQRRHSSPFTNCFQDIAKLSTTNTSGTLNNLVTT